MSRTDDDVEELPLDGSEYHTTGTTTEFDTERTGEEEETDDVAEVEEEEEEFYDTRDFISQPFLTEDCTVPEDILVFEYVFWLKKFCSKYRNVFCICSYSYGYDCKRHYNLVVADYRTLIFASGNLIHIFDIDLRRLKFRRSANGCGIGHIKVE